MAALRFRPRVSDDLTTTARWYNGERDGVGDEFLLEVTATLERVGTLPLSFPRVTSSARRALLDRFPYGAYFRVERDGGVLVLAVIHLHQEPGAWNRAR